MSLHYNMLDYTLIYKIIKTFLIEVCCKLLFYERNGESRNTNYCTLTTTQFPNKVIN